MERGPPACMGVGFHLHIAQPIPEHCHARSVQARFFQPLHMAWILQASQALGIASIQLPCGGSACKAMCTACRRRAHSASVRDAADAGHQVAQLLADARKLQREMLQTFSLHASSLFLCSRGWCVQTFSAPPETGFPHPESSSCGKSLPSRDPGLEYSPTDSLITEVICRLGGPCDQRGRWIPAALGGARDGLPPPATGVPRALQGTATALAVPTIRPCISWRFAIQRSPPFLHDLSLAAGRAGQGVFRVQHWFVATCAPPLHVLCLLLRFPHGTCFGTRLAVNAAIRDVAPLKALQLMQHCCLLQQSF